MIGPFAEEWRCQTQAGHALQKKDTRRQKRMRSQHRVKRACVAIYLKVKTVNKGLWIREEKDTATVQQKPNTRKIQFSGVSSRKFVPFLPPHLYYHAANKNSLKHLVAVAYVPCKRATWPDVFNWPKAPKAKAKYHCTNIIARIWLLLRYALAWERLVISSVQAL